MSLLQNLAKSKILKHSTVLNKSTLLTDITRITTKVPMFNVAFSGSPDVGFGSGITVFAGPSKHFKSCFGLLMVSSYMERFVDEDAICLFYDSEFGSSTEYFDAFNIDTSRVLHKPVVDIEELKQALVEDLNKIAEAEAETKKKQRVFIFIDSVGNLASRKEVQDVEDGKTTVDMTRAKMLKSLFRIVTPKIMMADIPCAVVGHTYDTQEMYSKKVVSGGCVVEGTQIQMADGALKPVEAITPGEYVKTLTGESEVTHAWNPETLENGTPECYEIEFEDGYKVTCSDKHKFLIMQGDTPTWVEAKDLIEGQDCVSV